MAGLYDFKFRSLQGDFELSARAAFESGRRLFIFFAAEGEPYAHLAQDLERELAALKPYSSSILFLTENRRDFEDPRMMAICKSLKGCSRALVRSESLKSLYSYYVCESRELPRRGCGWRRRRSDLPRSSSVCLPGLWGYLFPCFLDS